jgi:hypothetical protein
VGLEAIPRELLVVIAAISILVAIVSAARRFVARARLRVRFERAAQGERDAAAILEAHGYAIEGAQVTTSYPVHVDGAALEIVLRADYIVRQGAERWIAEVKTGQLAPSIQTAATRRQLLEYYVAFGVSGVLLVDAESRCVHRIAFPLSGPPPSGWPWRPFLWAVLLSATALGTVVSVRGGWPLWTGAPRSPGSDDRAPCTSAHPEAHPAVHPEGHPEGRRSRRERPSGP